MFLQYYGPVKDTIVVLLYMGLKVHFVADLEGNVLKHLKFFIMVERVVEVPKPRLFSRIA